MFFHSCFLFFFQDEFLGDVVAMFCPKLKTLTLISEVLNKQVTDQGLIKYIDVTIINNSQLEYIDILRVDNGITIDGVSELKKLPMLRRMSLNLRQLKNEELSPVINPNIQYLELCSSWDEAINLFLPVVNKMFPNVSSLVLKNRFTGQQELPNWEQSIESLECEIGKSSDLNQVFAMFAQLENVRITVPSPTFFSEFFEMPSTLNIRKIELNFYLALFRDRTPECITVKNWMARFPFNVEFKFRVKSNSKELWQRFLSELKNFIRETPRPIEIEHLDPDED